MKPEEQGVFPDRYAVIPRTLIFLTRGDRVLLLKGAPTKRLWANRYNGLGGHIERGEDVLTAARRELAEEANLTTPIPLRLCGTVLIDTGQERGIALFVLRGEAPPDWEPQPSLEGTPEWVPIAALADYPLVEDLHTLLPKVLAMRPEDPPFAACYTFDGAGRLHIRFG